MSEPPARRFEITHQHVDKDYDGQGNFSEHYRVHFRTPSGTESHVKVPREHYTARNVHDMISAEAQRIEQVHALGAGEPPPHEQDQPIEP